MTVGVLLISHGLLGQNMLDLSVKTLSVCPLATQALTVPFDSDPDKVTQTAENMVQELDTGDGVLVLTDLCGATPSNIACRLIKQHHVMVVSGLNLPMLMRILNYPTLSLEEMADKAMDGGRQGIMLLPGNNEA
jgi:PTS system mannose-specific IIA component